MRVANISTAWAISLFHRLSSRDVPAITTDPPFGIDNAERWCRRAAEIRMIAERMSHLPLAQASLLETAEEYERRAARAEGVLE